MKRWVIIALTMFIPSFVSAQTTSVSGTITDSGGVVWKNGTYTFTFTPSPDNPTAQYRQNGVPFNKFTTISGSLDATGSLTSVAVPDNLTIVPSGNTWAVQVCPAGTASNGCFKVQLTITGGSQSITSSVVPPAIVLDLTTPPPGGASAYNDGEIIGARVGSQYFNLTDATIHVCTFPLCTWVAVGAAGAPVFPGGTSIQAQFNNSGSFGGSPCISLNNLLSGAINQDCDTRFRGPNPWFDITRYGARNNASLSTTATCTSSSTSVTLASAQSYINGDGIVLHQCGSATALSTPPAPSSVTPKAILNGATTRSYEIVAEDYSLGMTASSPPTTITTSASTLGSNTIAISSFTCAPTSICTWTTTGNHNLEVGAKIQIAGATTTNGTVPFSNGMWYVQSTPSGTTFTTGIAAQGYYRVAGQQGSGTGGTITVNAHNWIRWTGQNGVLRYWIYRQDGGAGNYNLVGVAQGSDPFFDDYNYAAPAQTPEVPSTAPASAQNTALATSIVSGAGTVNIVVANQASNSIAGITALPDNSVAFNAAAAAALAAQGGAVFVPNPNGAGGFTFNFPLKLPLPSNNGALVYWLNGDMLMNQPLIAGISSSFRGLSSNNGGTASFGDTNYAVIFGTGYPVVFVPAVSTVTFDHVFIKTGVNSQQWGLLVDAASVNGGGATAVNLIDCYAMSQGAGGIPIVMRGIGFNHLLQRVTLNSSGGNSSDFFDRPSLRITSSSISSPVGAPSIANVKDLKLLGGGVEADSDSTYPGGSSGLSSWTFENVFTESLNTDVFDFRNIASGGFGNWSISDIKVADQVNEGSARQFDLSSPTVGSMFGLRINRPSGSGTDGAKIIVPATSSGASISGTTGNDLINAPGFGILPQTLDNGTSGQLASTITGTVVTGDTAFKITKGAPLFVQAASPTNLSATLAAGGSLPIGTYTYAVQALDINNGREQIVYFPTSVTTSTGNQTINLSWTAPSPAPQGYGVYQITGPLRGSVGGQGLVSCTPLLVGTTFSDISATMCGPNASIPTNDAGGPIGMSNATGFWSNQYVTTSGAFKTTASAAALTANRSVTWPDGSGTPLLGGTAYLTSTYTNATTTFSNVTGLSFPASANTNYKIRCDLAHSTSATTTGFKFQWTGPASPTAVSYEGVEYLSTTTFSTAGATAFSTSTGLGSGTVITDLPVSLTLTLLNGANAGTVQLQAAATGAGTLTILPGSCSLSQ